MIPISYAQYRHKLKGCFMGKAVGGTLGMPTEGYLGTKEYTYYDPVPTGMVANDDLDLQVVWVEVIRRCGFPVNRRDLADGWLEHMRALPDEYGVVIRNLGQRLYPPLSGAYDNNFYHGMGSAIRTEVWAALAPGDPDLAVRLAREDACLDHYGEGLEACIFLAAVESAAFVNSDRHELLKIGLSYIPSDGRLHRALTDTIQWCAECDDPLAIREKILSKYFHQNWTNVSINLSYITMAWLLGKGDISKSLCMVAGMGYDTDCTAATLGSIMGIIEPDGLEERWLRPLGDDLILSSCISNMHEVRTITELCDQIGDLCVESLQFYGSNTQLEGAPARKGDRATAWAPDARLVGLKEKYDLRESLVAVRPFVLRLFYPEKVALAPGESGQFRLAVSNPQGGTNEGTLTLRVPDGWSVVPATFPLALEAGREQTVEFTVTAPANADRRIYLNLLDIQIECGNLRIRESAGLMQTVDFLHVATHYESTECPADSLFKNADVVSAYAHAVPLEEGEHLFMAEFRSPCWYPEVIAAFQGTRYMKVWVDGKLVIDHDGAEYVPAFHRSDYITMLTMNGAWTRVVIQTGRQGRDALEEDPVRSLRNARVVVPGSPSTLQMRLKYDQKRLLEGEDGEMFFGFASTTGTKWIEDLEWRLPRLEE